MRYFSFGYWSWGSIGILGSHLGNVNGIALRTKAHLTVHELPESWAIIYKTVDRIANKLRVDPLTDTSIAVGEAESVERQAAVSSLQDKMKDMVRDAQNDEDFTAGVRLHMGDVLDYVWVLIGD